jgi:hypothetical protein
MKKILLLASTLSLIATNGCLVSDGRRHGEYREQRPEHFEHHEEVIVTHPVVVVHPPEIIVR